MIMAANLKVVLTVFAMLTSGYTDAVEFDIVSLSETIRDISHQLMQLKSENSAIRQEYDAMKRETSDKIAKINDVNQKLQMENSALREDVNMLKETISELGFVNKTDPPTDRFKSRSNHNQRDMTGIYERKRKIGKDGKLEIPLRKRLLLPPVGNHDNQSEVAVAFSARMHGDLTLGKNQDVVYSSVITNLGHGYDRRYGYFIAPVRGVYLFSASIFTDPSTYVNLSMVKNGVDVAYLYSHNNGWDLGSQTIVLVLEKGEVVWMKHDDITDHPGASTLKGGYTTFSGVLINALSDA